MSESSIVSTINDECQTYGIKHSIIGAWLSFCRKCVARICSIISSGVFSKLDTVKSTDAFAPIESCERIAILKGFGSSMVRVPLINPVLPSSGIQRSDCDDERNPPMRHVTINSSSCSRVPQFRLSCSLQFDTDSWPQNQDQDECCENFQPNG